MTSEKNKQYQKLWKANNRTRLNEYAKKYRLRNWDKLIVNERKRNKKYYDTPEGKAVSKKNAVLWTKRNPDKAAAHSKLQRAIICGKIIKQPCRDCGLEKVDGHHPDYSKPLEVIWLCRIHHKAEHRRINETL